MSLVEQGVLKKDILYHLTAAPLSIEPIEISKVSGIQGKYDRNTTLPIEYEGVKSVALLDSGTGINIATKRIWQKGGKFTIS